MKIYIAAPYPLRDDAIALMHTLEHRGHEVTSRWLKQLDENNDETARADLEDVRWADTLIFLHPEAWHDRGTGGRHFEMGYAYALAKRIILIGQRTSIFHHLSDVEVIDSIAELENGPDENWVL